MFSPSTAEGSGWEFDSLIGALEAGAVWQREQFGTMRPRPQTPSLPVETPPAH
jgi:hypothetical protein